MKDDVGDANGEELLSSFFGTPKKEFASVGI